MDEADAKNKCVKINKVSYCFHNYVHTFKERFNVILFLDAGAVVGFAFLRPHGTTI